MRACSYSKSFGELGSTVHSLWWMWTLTAESEMEAVPLWDRNSQNTKGDSKLLVMKSPSFAYKFSSLLFSVLGRRGLPSQGEYSQAPLLYNRMSAVPPAIWLPKGCVWMALLAQQLLSSGVFPFHLVLGAHSEVCQMHMGGHWRRFAKGQLINEFNSSLFRRFP